KKKLKNQKITSLERRAKYLLMTTPNGTAIMHLGMSGSFRVVTANSNPEKHDHYDLVIGKKAIRFNDPRRFGALLWTNGLALEHPLLAKLGPEPLGPFFTGALLYAKARGRKTTIKQFIMDGRIVVGVGNIYASEALYMAGIHPRRPAGRVGRERMLGLVESIRSVLSKAIVAGGTTLRDFSASDGSPGYFQQELQVYDRAGEACNTCSGLIRQETMGQRSTFFCVTCQR
ncbi:MAG: bifunctional DNA-formamidopyrimidine glycosylase/DNA-(apurinic or apyrimidinic site) lyase, partial [Pseudomonadota bacterium]